MSERWLKKALFAMGLAGVALLLVDIGFIQRPAWQQVLDFLYFPYIITVLLGLLKELSFCPKGNSRFKLSRYFIIAFGVGFLLDSLINTFFKASNFHIEQYAPAEIFILLFAFVEISEWLYSFQKQSLHPAIIFVLSFFVLISIGTVSLMLPNATVNGISFIDALFTSTSAVCVTGLAVLDTGKDFTRLGQYIIMSLIQFGGLGVMTFTSLFALLFRGGSSFQNRLALKDYLNSSHIGDAVSTLYRIIGLALLIELAGVLGIFFSTGAQGMPFNERLFFSIFHAVSAFCNAGFSTLSNSLYEEGYRFNYPLHIIIACLFILGGIGYAILFNYLSYAKRWLLYNWAKLRGSTTRGLSKPLVTLNTKIVVTTTAVLIITGTVAFYFFEYHNTLAEHTGFGKWVAAFFGGVTPRTAGFNSVNTGALAYPTLMIYLLLMWIGASPGSTGGGIKTSTFAIATLNIFQQVSGREKITLGWKTIPPSALQRATTIISLSLIAVGLSVFLIISIDGELGMLPVAFECFSAYSTVGLSMGITAQFSEWSKFILIITMFIGRVSFLTFLIGMYRMFFKHRQYTPYQYPQEEILIN